MTVMLLIGDALMVLVITIVTNRRREAAPAPYGGSGRTRRTRRPSRDQCLCGRRIPRI